VARFFHELIHTQIPGAYELIRPKDHHTICIIGEDNNGGQGKGYPKSDQTFQADFNELLFVLIALKLIEILSNSHSDQIIYNSEIHCRSFGKIEIALPQNMVPQRNRISPPAKRFVTPRKYSFNHGTVFLWGGKPNLLCHAEAILVWDRISVGVQPNLAGLFTGNFPNYANNKRTTPESGPSLSHSRFATASLY
jgi:hypothetical protein